MVSVDLLRVLKGMFCAASFSVLDILKLLKYLAALKEGKGLLTSFTFCQKPPWSFHGPFGNGDWYLSLGESSIPELRVCKARV